MAVTGRLALQSSPGQVLVGPHGIRVADRAKEGRSSSSHITSRVHLRTKMEALSFEARKHPQTRARALP